MTPNEPLIEEYLVRRIQAPMNEYGFFFAVSPEVIVKKECRDALAESMAHTMTVGMKMTLPYHELLQYSKPRDWWQAVKERFAPKWFAKRWPVQFDEFKIAQLGNKVIPPKNFGDIYTVLLNGKPPYSPPYGDKLGFCCACRSPMPIMTPEENVPACC